MSSSTVPSHQYHPPRHPHAISATIAKPPTTPPSFATGYIYPSSTTAIPTTSAYRSTGPPSIISTSSSPSPRLNPGLAAARHVSKAASRLKRSRSDNTKKSSEQLADDVIDEGFFSGPGSPPLEQYYPHHSATSAHKARGKIKPLLKKVSGSSRGNSLDLSRSDGGLPGGVGLGIFDNAGDSSGVDEDSPYSNRHRRNFSGTSGNSPLLVNAPFSHPKRQVPRRGAYTPEVSHYNTSNESSDESDDESLTRRTVLQGSGGNCGGSRSIRGSLQLNTGGRSTPMLPTSSLTDLHSRRISTSTLTTPVSPVSPLELPPIRSSTLESVVTIPQQPSPTGSRAPSFKISRIGRTSSETTRRMARDPSPGFAASVTAARLAWEAKEEKKEEKRERKRRRSEAKGEERSRATSRCSGRERGNSDGSNKTTGTVWDDDELPTSFPEKVLEEDGTEERGRPRVQSAGTGTGGKRWSVGKEKRPGFKKRWLGFVVWVRIGMVRMGRRLGF